MIVKHLICAILTLSVVIRPDIAVADLSQTVRFNIESQALPDALARYSEQSGVQVTSPAELVHGKISGSVVGSFPVRSALELLLKGTDLAFDVIGQNTVTIRASGGDQPAPGRTVEGTNGDRRLAQADAPVGSSEGARGDPEPTAPSRSTENPAIFEVLVTASKILNMDIRRSENDAQPYVILGRTAIENSSAANLEAFLKERLTMNAVGGSSSQMPGNPGTVSQVNLRGLGANQTLILVDGHRAAGALTSGAVLQPDLNGIPLSAIERIEVLPTTASGIYGGGATGGVINIVLRRDYRGVDAKVNYENVFEGDAATRRVDLGAGFNLEGGKTHVLIAASYSDSDSLLVQDRDFVERGRAAIQSNNPAFFLPVNSPPLGATPNIRSATLVNGVLQNLTLKSTGQSLNSTFTSVPAGYSGIAGDGGAALVANAGRYNLDLARSAQLTSRGSGGFAGLTNGPTLKSLTTTLRREFGSNVQAFLELAGSDSTGEFPFSRLNTTFAIDAAAPTNPFNQAIQVTVPSGTGDGHPTTENRNRRAVGGLIVKLPGDWMAEADYTWSRARFSAAQPNTLAATGLAAVRTGALEVLRDTNAFPLDFSPYVLGPVINTPADTTLKDATLRAAGPVAATPAGPLIVSALIEYRDESFDESSVLNAAGGFTQFFPSKSQSVKSAYLEAKIPLVSDRNSLPGVKRLDLQLAGRHDEYTVDGVTGIITSGPGIPPAPIVRATNEISSTDPTVGLRYEPLGGLMLRASYGTGFLPPSVSQLAPSAAAFNAANIIDPRRGNTQAAPSGTIPGLFIGNPDLQPEESESWSLGVVFTPRFVPGLRLSVDYSRIEKTNNITDLTVQQLVNNEELFAGRITRGASLPGDQPGWAGPITFIDDTSVNIARTQVEAYDVQLDQRFETARAGAFDFSAIATWQTDFRTQTLPSSPVIDNVGTISGGNILNGAALRLCANAELQWSFRGWTLGWSTRYYDSYRLATAPQSTNQGAGGVVPSQTYHDALARYRFGANSPAAFLEGTEVQVGVKNVFNKEPPLDMSTSSGTFYSFLGDPRLATYYVTLKHGF